jgi:hypothetical protein
MRPPGCSTFADLPTELVIHSFKFGASTSREFCFTLTLVSSWARDIALPYLRKTVILKTTEEVEDFLHYLSEHRNYAAFVVNIWFPATWSYCRKDISDMKALLEECHNAVNLSVTGPLLLSVHLMAFQFFRFNSSGLRLFIHDEVQISEEDSISPFAPRISLFNITHIHTNYEFFTDRVVGIGIASRVAEFPNLTHLAIDVVLPDLPLNVDEFNDVLNSPKMTVLVLVVDHQRPHNVATIRAFYNGLRERSTGRLQVRVAFGECLTVWRGTRQEWLDEVEGRKQDVWERAIQDTKKWNEDMKGACVE